MRIRSATIVLFSAAGLAALTVGTSCRYDPVPQAIIDSLPADDSEPGPNHRAGQPCNVCHSKYGGATPIFAVSGTAYTTSMDGTLVPAANVAVTVRDSAGSKRPACTKTSGNFYIEADNWDTITYPLSATVGDRDMSSLIGREGSCSSCHKGPEGGATDAGTGASHDSPGVILVDVTAPGASCGGAM